MNSKFTQEKPIILKAKKLTMYFRIPFISNSACKFMERELRYVILKYYPHINLNPVFMNNLSIQGLTNHKEKLPVGLSSGIVYLFQCGACSATYIGHSKKCLLTRAHEHLGRSSRTGNLLVRPPQSSIREHLERCNSGGSLENFKVLGSFNEQILLKISESLEIHFKKPSLNVDGSSFPLQLV